MKFLCDVHISVKLVKTINKLGFEAIHINSILNKWNTADQDIINYADANDFIVITKDKDFRNSFLISEKPKKLIKIDLGNISNVELISIFESLLKQIEKVNKESEKYMLEIGKTSSSFILK